MSTEAPLVGQVGMPGPSTMLRRSVYLGSMLASTALAFAKVFVFAALLDRAGFGQYSLALLVFSIASYIATVGLSEGLAREVPILRGVGRSDAATRARDASVIAALVLSGLVGMVCAVVVTLISRSHPDYGPVAWVGLLVWTTVPLNLLLIDLTGRHMSDEYAVLMFFKNGVALLCGIIGLSYAGVSGALIGESGAAVMTAVLCVLWYDRDLIVRRESMRALLTEARRVARLGLPYMIASVVLTLTLSIDRWFVQYRFGVETFGIYSFAFLVWTAGMVFSNVVSTYVQPRIVGRFAQSHDVHELFTYLRRMTWSVLGFFVVGAAPALLLLRWIIEARYPQYREALPIIGFVYVGTAFWCMNFYAAVFVIRGDGRYPLFLGVANGIVCLIVLLIATLFHPPLLVYAAVFCIFRGLYFASSVVLAHHTLDNWRLQPAHS